MNEFNFFLPISKVQKNQDGSCLVSGYASTPALDLDGEVVALDAVRKALPGYWQWRNIRQMHTNSAVGRAQEANIDKRGLFLTAKITDKDAVQKCLDRVYQGFSIGGRKLAKSGNVITEIEMIEISVVDRPSNPECRFAVQKSANAGAGAYLTKLPRPFRDPRDRAVRKMAAAVEALTEIDPSQVSEFLKAPAQDGFHFLPKVSDPPAADAGAERDTDKGAGMDGACDKHGIENCAKCMKRAARKAAKAMRKRGFTEAQRQQAASTGAALPDGSFPIKNKGDLANARQAIGRAKNPGKARAHIRARAAALGVKLPPNWSKKEAAALIKSMLLSPPPILSKSAETPSSLSLSADLGLGSNTEGGHDFDVAPKGDGTERLPPQLRLKKSGTDVPVLAAGIGQKASGADDQDLNSLLEELNMSANSGQDGLGQIILNAVKAARSPSRAQHLRIAQSNLKKVGKARKEARGAVMEAHKALEKSYLAKQALIKAGKKPAPDDDADDMEKTVGAMRALQKAYGALNSMKTFQKAASDHLAKAASRAGQRGQEVSDPEAGVYEVPPGIKDLSNNDLVTAGPGGGESGSTPFVHDMLTPFPGKSAKIKKGLVTAAEADAMARAAAAEAKVEILEKLPAGPVFGNRRPAAFDLSKLGVGNSDEAKSLFKGIRPEDLASENENVRRSSVAKFIGNHIFGGHGKSVFDSDFHGTLGAELPQQQ